LTQEIKEYILTVNTFLNGGHSADEKKKFSGEMLTRIGFYQHERFIHLIVMALFAVMTIISFAVSFEYDGFLLLFALFMVLLIPYVGHYYFLENSVQKLYKLYYKLQDEDNG